MESEAGSSKRREQLFVELYRNMRNALNEIKTRTKIEEGQADDKAYYEKFRESDGANAYLYILFVLTFYAFSIAVLMIKYIR
jgi:hypothetical protein